MSKRLPNSKTRLYSLNNEIQSKTKIALKAIKDFEDRQQRLKEHTKNMIRKQTSFVQSVEKDYCRIIAPKEIHLHENIKVQIFPHNDEYYVIDTSLIIFPLRIFIKNVRNSGNLLIKYDIQSPIQEIYEDPKDQAMEKQKRISSKFFINKDIMIPLYERKKLKNTKKVFLFFTAKSQLFMFNLKYDYIGYQGYQFCDQLEKKQIKKSSTQKNLSSHHEKETGKLFLPELDTRINNERHSQRNRYRYNSLSDKEDYEGTLNNHRGFSQKIQNYNQLEKNLNLIEQNQKKCKNFIARNNVQAKEYAKKKSKQARQFKHQKSMEKQIKIKTNQKNLEQFKKKDYEMRQLSSIFKRKIELYQKNFVYEKKGQNKLIKKFLPFILATIFVQNSNKLYLRRDKQIGNAVITQSVVNRFINNLKKMHKDNVSLIPRFKMRNNMSVYHFLELGAKFIRGEGRLKASQIIYTTFQDLSPALVLNYALERANKYRKSVRIVQKRWLLKRRARFQMLMLFGNNHVQKMMKEYPHLKLAKKIFRQQNICYKIVHQYIIDESSKFRYIYDAFVRRVAEIESFIDENQKIREYNLGKPQKKWKQYLDIPRKPLPPQQRTFRNLDILKSMLRGWFELQYKKIVKRNIYGK